MTYTIGILSDTHGLLRPEVLATLRASNVDHILHAGDVGNHDILTSLRQIAPVTAIRGNIDTSGPCAQLPATEAVELAGHLFYLVHSIHDLDLDPAAAGISAVVSGHSHRPETRTHRGVLYLNPGSCGPRRFDLPITLSILALTDTLRPDLIPLL
jgi:putative phosphoesterase